jgi:hypothetical protein
VDGEDEEADTTTPPLGVEREMRNIAIIFLAYLVCVQKSITTATLNFLTVGHTHEYIDQVFAFICSHFEQPASNVHDGRAN